MALQAQYPATKAFSPDFGCRGRNDALEELQMLRDRGHQIRNLAGAYAHLGQQIPTALSDPHSELTCNAVVSASRKRSREYPSSVPINGAEMAAGVSQLLHEQSRLLRSSGASTSGRPAAVSAPSPAVSPLAQVIVSHLHHQSVEIDALIRIQTERIRSELEEAGKRHCSAVLSVLGAQAVKRLREKDAELESANRMNAELEEKLRQVSGENQIWFNAAKNSEAIVSSLRTSVEQLLHTATAAVPPAKEGYGDSDCVPFPVDDAQSCCFDDGERGGKVARVTAEEGAAAAAAQREKEELRWRRACCVCKAEEVCVLLLPCRHLCLCKDCEPRIDTCPICHSTKNASLQIFMS